MQVVVDAGVVVALFVADPRQADARALFDRWMEDGDELHAPAVLQYEVMNVLARQVWDGELRAADADAVWTDLDTLGIA
ncbi:MAG: PIN domain-containing protein [Candidatus Dormibacteria bacterium]